jgi:hypothetical protein
LDGETRVFAVAVVGLLFNSIWKLYNLPARFWAEEVLLVWTCFWWCSWRRSPLRRRLKQTRRCGTTPLSLTLSVSLSLSLCLPVGVVFWLFFFFFCLRFRRVDLFLLCLNPLCSQNMAFGERGFLW